jgi:hypothetical protein
MDSCDEILNIIRDDKWKENKNYLRDISADLTIALR